MFLQLCHKLKSRRWWQPDSDRSAILCLITVALLLKIVVLLQHPILARDGIMHLHFAHDLLERPWASTLKEHPFHPGYALTLAVTSNIFQLFDPGPLTPSEWQWCAHLSSSFAGILLLLPLYGLARCFYSIRTAWLGTLLFALLPSVVQITTDTLTESWYLLFMFSALWSLVMGVRTQRSSWFVVTGLLTGAAYIVRVEAVLILAAIVVCSILYPWIQHRFVPSSSHLRNIALLGFCFLLPPLPYMMTIGKFSNRPAVQTIVHQDSQHAPYVEGTWLLAAQRLQDGVNGLNIDVVHWYEAVTLVLFTHGRAGHYYLWPLAGVGFFLLWRSRRGDPALLLILCVVGLHLLMLFRLALTAGYTSERHTLLFVALAAQTAAIGMIAIGQWLRRTVLPGKNVGRSVTAVLAAGVVALSLPKAVQPLHHGQEAHRQAGLWLAEHLHYDDHIVDPYNWASFYAGVTFMPKRTMTDSNNTLGVIDPKDADLNRQRDWKNAGLLSTSAKTIWSWPSSGKPKLIIRQESLNHEGGGSTFNY